MLKLQSEWLFDTKSSIFVTESALIRVVALPAEEAALRPNAMERAEALTQLTLDRTGYSAVSAKQVTARAFTDEPDSPPSRTVLAYQYATQEDVANEKGVLVAFTRVYASDSNVYISTISDDPELPDAVYKEVLHAVVAATETIAEGIARHELLKEEGETKGRSDTSLLIQRGLLGVSDFQKKLYEDAGYSTALTDRIEMTAILKDMDSSSVLLDEHVRGIEVRALDLAEDDLIKVYDLLKSAFGSGPPSYETWKRHYWQQPRLAADMSFVAWHGDQPVSAALIELLVDGEGGGEAELEATFHTERQLAEELEEAKKNGETVIERTTDLQFPQDYEQRQAKVREIATTGYVVAVATVSAFRGQRLAQRVLQHGFRAAKRAGLESVGLCTDRQNPGAVRAYERAGMVETKTSNEGYAIAREFKLSP